MLNKTLDVPIETLGNMELQELEEMNGSLCKTTI
jgi:hypothetical protein